MSKLFVTSASGHVGTPLNPAWVEENFKKYGIDTVFLCLTGVDELFTACKFCSSIIRSGCVKHLIYLSACGNLMPEVCFP
ncbi:MAG: hypothetical protein LQ338_001146 [Usnochroma carphineum]|nr:MAG: hypothetical protein LQ338_001146 [Usnochroma carphineum]